MTNTAKLVEYTGGADAFAVALPTSTRGTEIAIGAVTLVCVLGLGLWSCVATIAHGAVAEGSVVVESTRKTIQHLEGGIVAEILVKDGDYVHAHQKLLRLSDARSLFAYAILEDKFDQDRALASRLRAERDGAASIEFPPDLTQRAQMNLETQKVIDAQRAQFDIRRRSEAGKVQLIEQKIAELTEQIKGVAGQVKSKEAQYQLLAEEMEGVKKLYAKGLETKTKLLALQRSSEDINGSKGEYLAHIQATNTNIDAARMEILQAERTFREDVVEKLREVTSEELDLRDKMASLKESMSRLDVISPIDGQVVGSAVHTIGGVVSPGEKLMDIVPAEDKLVVDAHVAPTEINKVVVGFPVDVRLVALRQRTAPTLIGAVISVASDVQVEPSSHSPYYDVRVEINAGELSKLGTEKLVAGMPVEVLIKGGERTVISYLMAPITDSVFRSFRQE